MLQITKPELPEERLRRTHQNIAGFFTVSSLTGEGVELLYRTILHVTLEQPYIGELIPESWLKTGRAIVNKRKTASLLNWTAVETQVSQNNESCSLKHGQNAGKSKQ